MARLRVSWLMVLLLACVERQPGLRWVVPERFNGCVWMEFQVAGAPPLPLEEGKYTIVVPEQGGSLQTSTRPEWGEGLRSEYWRQAGALRERIQPSCHGSTTSHVERGTVEVARCFGKVSKLDCEKAKNAVPR
ncbi:hypothetical protein [Myxococcus sp. RHSTA-1-4]|uniref:hypothetical protein n=1 Tax=Myxococcus sp. RHSTA-1-4 TaxID=2874601 RepID=UPI001CC0C9BA|nr:hypothetical protein [Myxococcus sp. RHSTA-1-4]MBZ4419257.1 hypothetical protein [Myxococcus sp. RHSTA-1-4]